MDIHIVVSPLPSLKSSFHLANRDTISSPFPTMSLASTLLPSVAMILPSLSSSVLSWLTYFTWFNTQDSPKFWQVSEFPSFSKLAIWLHHNSFIHPLMTIWIGLSFGLGNKSAVNMHIQIPLIVNEFNLGVYTQKRNCWIVWKFYFNFFEGPQHCFSKWSYAQLTQKSKQFLDRSATLTRYQSNSLKCIHIM